MSLAFRDGGVGDVPAAAHLLQHSFPGAYESHAEVEAVLTSSPRGGPETLWVGEEDGQLIAACRLYRLQQWIGGTTIPIMGLGAVAISAAARRRGIAARLVRSALQRARQRGELASALYPFKTSFYQRLGYGMAGEALQYRVPPATLRDHPARVRVRMVITQEDRDAVADVYDRWAPTQTGQLLRSERAWELIWRGGKRHGAVCYSPEGEPDGYAVVFYNSEPARGGRALEVEEIAWLTPDAQLGLYAWLASLSDQWDAVVYRAHPDEGFQEHLSELRYPTEGSSRWHFWFPAASLLQGPMFRLLDIEGSWQSRAVPSAPPLTVALEVQDEDIPENRGTWMLRFVDGGVDVSGGERGSADLKLSAGIEVVSRLFIASLSPSAAVAAGVASTDRPGKLHALDRLLRLPRPWMFDRF